MVTNINSHASINEFVNKFKYETMRCVNCPILQQCKQPRKKLTKARLDAEKIALNVYKEEIELDDSAENQLRAEIKKEEVKKDYIAMKAPSILANERCIFEKKEIVSTLQKFIDAGYDISDPRVFLIVSELVGNILNSGRANKSFTALGVILRKDSPAGPIYYENPLLKTKMMFSKLIIEATETLDRILKSDEQQKAGNDFTSHLLKALKIRENKKVEIAVDQFDTLEYQEDA